MTRSFPPLPESGEALEDVESEDIAEDESEAEGSEEGEEIEEDEFYMARRERPADDLNDTAGSSPSTHEDDAGAAADELAPAAHKWASSTFADEESLWSS